MTDKYSELVDQYHRDGYVIIRDVIDDRLIKECQQHIDFLQKKYPSIPGEHFHHPIMRNDPFWIRLVSDQRLLDLAAIFGTPFIKPEQGVALFSSHYFAKPAKTGMRVLWHQDGKSSFFPICYNIIVDTCLLSGAYWPLKPMNVLTMWLAVDNSDTENGCLRVIRGSHKQDLTTLKDDSTGDNVLGSYTHRDEDIDSSKIVDIVLKPGGNESYSHEREKDDLMIRYEHTPSQYDSWF